MMRDRLNAWIAGPWTSRQEFIAFLVSGALNTLLTYGFYLALLLVVGYPIAYSGSFIVGIFLSYYLNARFVFREPLRLSKALQYPAVYVVQYLLGLGLIYFFVSVIHIDKEIAPLPVVLLTVPFTFFLSRYIVRGRR